MKRTGLSALLVSLLLSSSATAQQVTLRGEIDDTPGGTFVLDDTSVALSSSAQNLAAFLGQRVTLTGDWNGSFTAPSIDVLSVAPSAEQFDFDGLLRIGSGSSIELVGEPGRLASGLLSLGSSFLPLRRGEVALIDPVQRVWTGTGILEPDGELDLSFSVPDDPSLVGIQVFGQGVVFGSSQYELTNLDVETIRN